MRVELASEMGTIVRQHIERRALKIQMEDDAVAGRLREFDWSGDNGTLIAQNADWQRKVTGAVLRVDGGMSASDWTMQFLADTIGAPVDRPKVLETGNYGTRRGVARRHACRILSGSDRVRRGVGAGSKIRAGAGLDGAGARLRRLEGCGPTNSRQLRGSAGCRRQRFQLKGGELGQNMAAQS